MKKFLLVGNANTGKTTLLNSLTKSFEHTGNWHGVTVEEKEKKYVFENEEFCVVDLPGIYSLNALSFEEQLAINKIFLSEYDLIVCTADISTLAKNLFLTLDLLLAGKTNLILAINTFGKKHSNSNFQKISNQLQVQVVPINFSSKQEVALLKKQIKNFSPKTETPNYFSKIFSSSTNAELENINRKFNINKYEIIKIIEKNNYFLKKINKNNLIFNFFNNYSKINYQLLAQEKYFFLKSIVQKSNKNIYGKEVLDKFFLNKFFALPIFFLIMLGIFYVTFFGLGAFLSDLLSNFVQGTIGGAVVGWLDGICKIPWVVGLVEHGIFDGVGSLVAFLPQVVLLFLFLAILEDTGYFSRIAFIFEDMAQKVGLSGKSVYTLLMGFGCSASAVLTSRALDNQNAKIKTVLITPYMSCSAKLPVFAVLGGAFFGASNLWVIFLLYLLGVFVAVLVSSVLDKFFLKNKTQTFLQEFPPYRFPKFSKICQIVWNNMKIFLVKVTTIFVSMNVIVWCLGNFAFDFSYVPLSNEKSILQVLGEFFAPIFAPLGFNNWAAVSALLAGIIAKEIIVSSLAIFNGLANAGNQQIASSFLNPNSTVFFTSQTALSYLSFCLLYCPCLATTMVMKKEIGWKWTLIGIIIQLFVAYATAFVVFNTYALYQCIGIINLLLIFAFSIIFVFSISKIINFVSSKDKCKNCGFYGSCHK